jgi:alkylation response protein AidB-like acyl-CoA dehydrogenase
MDFTFTAEQDELRDQARSFLAERPEAAWSELAELGWTGVSVPEELGGAGLTFVEEAVLLEETARALYHGPFFSTVALALPALPDEQLREVAAGETSWTLALAPLVSDLDTADRIAIVGGDGIYELENAERDVLATTDESRPLGALRGGAPGRRLAGSQALEVIRPRALTALALEACGVARRALELAVEYAASREQFGKPIGIYQAISHPLADAFTQVELGRSLSYWAAWCVATGDDQAGLAAAAAKAYAAEAAVTVCEASIQAHGGIGFTWEHVLHRLYKRALWVDSFLATGARLRAEIAAELLEGPTTKDAAAGTLAATAAEGG